MQIMNRELRRVSLISKFCTNITTSQLTSTAHRIASLVYIVGELI